MFREYYLALNITDIFSLFRNHKANVLYSNILKAILNFLCHTFLRKRKSLRSMYHVNVLKKILGSMIQLAKITELPKLLQDPTFHIIQRKIATPQQKYHVSVLKMI